MRSSMIAALALTGLICPHSFAASITVKPGDTLSDLADKHNVSLGTLMRMNDIRDSDSIRAGNKLLIPDKSTINSTKGIHIVSPGETLSTIALRYRASQEELISLNSLSSANYLYIGQQIKLPNRSNSLTNTKLHKVKKGESISTISKKYNVNYQDLMSLNGLDKSDYIYIGQKIRLPQEAINSTNNTGPKSTANSSQHVVTQGQTLSKIAKAYDMPVSKLIKLNNLKNPDTIKEGTRLTLKEVSPQNTSKESKATKWRTYGPLKVDWSNWKSMGGSFVTPSINKEGKALYLAVNCSVKKINATGAKGEWRKWNSPLSGFEFKLIKDLCSNKNS